MHLLSRSGLQVVPDMLLMASLMARRLTKWLGWRSSVAFAPGVVLWMPQELFECLMVCHRTQMAPLQTKVNVCNKMDIAVFTSYPLAQTTWVSADTLKLCPLALPKGLQTLQQRHELYLLID